MDNRGTRSRNDRGEDQGREEVNGKLDSKLVHLH